MGQGGRADQQRGYCSQRAFDGHHRRSNQAHDRRQPGFALLGECRDNISKIKYNSDKVYNSDTLHKNKFTLPVLIGSIIEVPTI